MQPDSRHARAPGLRPRIFASPQTTGARWLPIHPHARLIQASMAGSRSTAPLNRSKSVLIVAPLCELARRFLRIVKTARNKSSLSAPAGIFSPSFLCVLRRYSLRSLRFKAWPFAGFCKNQNLQPQRSQRIPQRTQRDPRAKVGTLPLAELVEPSLCWAQNLHILEVGPHFLA